MVEETQVVVHEGDEPDFIRHLLDPDVLPSENLAQFDLSFAQANSAAVGDGDRSVATLALLGVGLVGPAGFGFARRRAQY